MIRVSQKIKFTHFVNNMNYSLSKLMDLNMQASSQKKINKPSDDPVGTTRILNYRDSLRATEQYRDNVASAKGWLGLADQTLTLVNTTLTRVKELAEQSATGTMSSENRKQVGFEVRHLFEQLIVLSNTTYENKHIFAGHKTQEPAFVEGLAMTTSDPNLSSLPYNLQGSADSTVLVQFLSNGNVGTDALNYRYSADGGDTWTTSTLASNASTLTIGGVNLTLATGATVSAVDPTDPHETNNGSWMWIRPAAVYQGDDQDAVRVDVMGAAPVTGSTRGVFTRDVVVRVDNTTSTTLASNVSYSYSMDGGVNWTTGNSISDASTPGSASLPVPGGFLELSSNGGNTLNPGDQFVIRPRRADVEFEISPNELMTVNGIGKDIFGGIYTEPGASNATAAFGGGAQNAFETVGKLVGYIETNNQSGIQQALENLNASASQIMVKAANVGAKENRLEATDTVLSNLELSDHERMSSIEDADAAELMTRLAQQELVYQSVLKSAAMVMKMNLTNFI
jgi:flagellar hook-associated protein 3 FlgL